MEELGCGVVSIRTVTIRKNGDKEEGSSVGEDVESVRPNFTTGFVDLFDFVKPTSILGGSQYPGTGGRDGHLRDRSFLKFHLAFLEAGLGKRGS